MRWVNGVLWIYAAMLLVLGAIGYFKDGSVISIVAGALSGLAIIGTLAWYKSNPRAARISAAVIALILFGNFIQKVLTKPAWHTITLTISSLLVVLILVGAHFYAMSKKNAVFPPDEKSA